MVSGEHRPLPGAPGPPRYQGLWWDTAGITMVSGGSGSPNLKSFRRLLIYSRWGSLGHPLLELILEEII